MAAATLDLLIEQGTDYELALTLASKAPDPGPLDLTGCQLRAHVRPHHGADAPLLYDLSTSNGRIVITDAAGGQATLRIPGQESAGWEWRQAVYDLELVDAGGRQKRLLQGAVRVDPEVTR
ncbi:hypothetical protein [Nonomuraea dietziae]|uniref:hypothetical protein n=1 Tax=Nonomuraea dietziae TaxID=65515 RepID=UPI0033F2F362